MNRRDFMFAPLALTLPNAPAFAGTADPVGLIFVGQSSCPYCQSLAPLLFDLKSRGMMVLPVSLDHAPLLPFPNYEDGTAHPISAAVTAVPHVLLYHAGLDRITHEIAGFRNLRSYIARLSAALSEARALT